MKKYIKFDENNILVSVIVKQDPSLIIPDDYEEYKGKENIIAGEFIKDNFGKIKKMNDNEIMERKKVFYENKK